jgi:hypothetical protein
MRFSFAVGFAMAGAVIGLNGCSPAPTFSVEKIPDGMHLVQALPPGSAKVAPAPKAPNPNGGGNLRVAKGRFFSYAMPEGWRVGEDGQFALTLVSPDNKALTVMVGNAGLPPGYSPARFVSEKLSAMQPQNLRVGQPRQVAPITGFKQAYEFDVDYSIRGVETHGVVKCHVAPAYDTQTMAMTAALAEASQWPAYSSWLPLVASQVSAINGAAFGMRGIMAQNLKNSTEYAEAARQYRDWSDKNWKGVTDARDASQDRNNKEFRDAIGGVQVYGNPFNGSAPVELPTTYKYYWTDGQGSYAGTDDPSVNPNVGATGEWRQMPQQRR